MKKKLLLSAILLASFNSFGQNDRSKKIESKYLSLPAYDISTTDPSTVTIEFAMKDGVFGVEKLKEGESTCMPKGGSLKDAVKVKAYHYEIPYMQQISYVIAKNKDGIILYGDKSSETGQGFVRFGWDEKMKQAKCEYAFVSDKLKKEYASTGNSFKLSEHKLYEKEIYSNAIREANSNVSLIYLPEEFEIYSAKGKTYNYDELDAALVNATNAYSSINNKGLNSIDLNILKDAISIWEKELETLDNLDKKARITEDIAKGLHENCARAYLYLYDFGNAKKHADSFQSLFGNFSNNRSKAFEAFVYRIYTQKNAAEKNAAILNDIDALSFKASTSRADAMSTLLESSQFDRLQTEFNGYIGSQASEIMAEKKEEEKEAIANGTLNPYQKYYYSSSIGGEGIIMNLPPSSLSGIPELTTFPVEICEFTNAKQVVILKNKITSIPSDIEKMTSLEKLDLSNNLLTTLPLEIGTLSNLETLKLSDNPIVSLPAELANCKNLTTLVLKGTKLNDEQIAEIQRMLPNCKIKI